MTDKLIKKVELLSNESSAQNRGERLKRVRNLANLSRKDFCELCELNINTLKGWEIGRYGGLPRDGAIKIINAVKAKNINCELNWLLHAEGLLPEIENTNNQKLIISEIKLFEKLVNNPVLSCQISDDGLEPQYNIGDWVAGRVLNLDDYNLFINKICIVQFENKILVRKVQQSKSKKKGFYNLFCTNSSTQAELVIMDVKIEKIALIERIYVKQ